MKGEILVTLYVFPLHVCVCVWYEIQLTMVHEAVVAEPHAQRHSVLSGRAVSLGNQINDAHTQSVTHNGCFTCTADCYQVIRMVICKPSCVNSYVYNKENDRLRGWSNMFLVIWLIYLLFIANVWLFSISIWKYVPFQPQKVFAIFLIILL